MRAVDLGDDEVDRLLARAAELAAGGHPQQQPAVLGALFLTPSLRTRIGFQVAMQRLGGHAVLVDELRVDATMSTSESYEDALRVISGMVDVMVTRTPFDAAPAALARAQCPVVNGGDDAEHPTQGLIDLAAIERFRGDVRRLRVGFCGDLRMRALNSLLALLARRPPRSLTLIHPDGRGPRLPDVLVPMAVRAELAACSDVDVLVMAGLPPGSGLGRVDDHARMPYILTVALVATMPEDAIVLNPMPVIDEIAEGARLDPRMRVFQQSDHATYVRMAILESVLAPAWR